MRRPSTFTLGGFTTGLLISEYFSIELSVLCMIFFMSMATGLWTVKYHKPKNEKEIAKIAIVLTLCITFLAGIIWMNIRAERTNQLIDSLGLPCTYTLEGKVIFVKPAADETKKDQLTIEREKDGLKVLVSIKGHRENIRDLAGRNVRVSGTLKLPQSATNPGAFDYARYLKSIGVLATMTTESDQIQVQGGEIDVITNKISIFKGLFIALLQERMEKGTAGILFGMLFGDKSYIEEDAYDDFQKNGTSHILSVSGIHVAIVYGLMEKLLGKGRRRNIPYNLTVAVLLAFYAALAGFAPSVVRAAFMILVYIFSKLVLRAYDFTSCICFTALALLIYNPFYVFNTGFVLSYSAVLVLAVLLPRAQRALKECVQEDPYGLGHTKKTLRQKAIEVFLPVFIIQLGMAPLTVYFFNYFSVSAFLVNPPVIFISGLLLPMGFLLAALMPFSGVCPFIFDFTAFITQSLIKLLTWLNHITASEGTGYTQVPSPSLKWVFLYYALFFYIASETGQIISKRRGKKQYAAVVLTALLLFGIWGPEGKYAKADVIFIDVGQGDAIHIKTPSGKNILIDGGGTAEGGFDKRDVGKDILYPYFMKNGIGEIDLAIITHLHEDHFGGAASLSQLMKIENIGLFEGYKNVEQEVKERFRASAKEPIWLKRGQSISLDKNVTAQILYPQGSTENEEIILSEDENENTLVIRICYDGITILDTGDLSIDGEMKLLSSIRRQNTKGGYNMIKSNIFKVGHHGSKYSTSEALLKEAAPDMAVIQVGKNNNFGHPTKEVLSKLKSFGIPTYRNDEQGAVLVDIKGKKVKILDMRDKKWLDVPNHK